MEHDCDPSRLTSPFPLRRRKSSGKTLLILGVALLALEGGLDCHFTRASERAHRRAAQRALLAVRDAKGFLRADIMAGERTMPSGYDVDSLGEYSPSLEDLAPYLAVGGFVHGDHPSNRQVMAGTGARSLELGALDEPATCFPPVKAPASSHGWEQVDAAADWLTPPGWLMALGDAGVLTVAPWFFIGLALLMANMNLVALSSPSRTRFD